MGKEQSEQNKDKSLHFVISPGRSGTTLLRKHLLENTSIHIPPESSSLIIKIAKHYVLHNTWESKVRAAIHSFTLLNLNQFWKINLQLLEERLLCQKIEQQNLRSLILEFYNSHKDQYNPEATILVYKTPILSQNLKLIESIFTESNYLFLISETYEDTYSRILNL